MKAIIEPEKVKKSCKEDKHMVLQEFGLQKRKQIIKINNAR